MIRSSSLRRFSLFTWFVFYIVLSSNAHAQISFVQISDPHLFDDTFTSVDNRWNDKAALVSAIDKINQQVLHNAQYKFVVVTGDLGLEELTAGITDPKQIKSYLEHGAADLASMLVLSKVHHWLFVPGNNDLLNEDPKNIEYYHLFIDALKQVTKATIPDFEIRDLCPRSDAVSDGFESRSDLLKIDNYVFIGFDDSSFKNYEKNAPTQNRINLNVGIQEKYVKLVKAQLDQYDKIYAYIFYHIPAIDDPHLIDIKPEEEEVLKVRSTAKDQIGGSYFRSAWFVDKKVRSAWNSIVIDPRVKGLFAGHFHNNQKQTYQSLSWLSKDYLDQEVDKLHVCPPLAMKFQNGEDEQARGFQEVYLDEAGKVSARILWLDQEPWSPNPVQKSTEDSAIKQLEMGQTFEQLGRLKEAEGAYAKAAESDWPPTRKAALAALTRLVNEQESTWNKYFRSPLTASLTALWTAFISIVPILIFARLAYLWGKRRGRNKVKFGPVIDTANGNAGVRFEQIAALILKRIHSHFKPRPLIKSDFKLPMLVKSQSPEIKEIIEATAPGGIGKLLGWVYSLFYRPRYSIHGIVDSDFFERWLFISLDDRGDKVDDWEGQSILNNLSAERSLAFKSLIRLIRHMN